MRSVLIVDDHAPFRSAVRLLLERGGFRVVGEAGDGDAALAAVQRLAPEVVSSMSSFPARTVLRSASGSSARPIRARAHRLSS
jgi:DNA-binding NarL/FixJ family response regulator